jgi:hypothetical protein
MNDSGLCEYDPDTKSCKFCKKGMIVPQLQRHCFGYIAPIPIGWPTKIFRYLARGAVHIAHGAPRCTRAQIDERLKICLSCPSEGWQQIAPNYGTCKYCGCCAGATEATFMNKLARADESCPQAHWSAVVNSK